MLLNHFTGWVTTSWCGTSKLMVSRCLAMRKDWPTIDCQSEMSKNPRGIRPEKALRSLSELR